MARLPDQIGKYDIVDRIGKGGMGMVYKARHPTLDRFVILKKLAVSGDAAMRERFRREAEIMIDFRTDYVVDVYDHFRHNSSDYIALEFVNGGSLDAILERERYLPGDVALLIVRDCCRGLEYVHSKGVVHRDVKPGNVILGRDGSVKLLDFGIASRVESFGEDLTRDGMTLGTVAYIAPEQIEQSRTADVRADIYSTGAMLYEMVTGRKAFPGGFTPENVNRIQRGRYRRPRRVNLQVSRFASRLIRRCMKRNPKRRFQSAGKVAVAIDRNLKRRSPDRIREQIGRYAGNEAVTGTGESTSRRRWPRVLLAAAVVVLLAGVAAYATGYFQRFFLGDTHGLVYYQLRLRKGERAVGEHLLRLELQRLNSGELVNVNPVLPLLHPVASLETPDYIILRSRLLTLPAGRYRSTIQVGETYVREEFSVLPVSMTTEAQLLSVRYDAEPPSALNLTVHAYDAPTGAELSDAVAEAEIEGRWIALRPLSNEPAAGDPQVGDTRPGESRPEDGSEEILVPVDDLSAVLLAIRDRAGAQDDESLPGESSGPDPVPQRAAVFVPGETIRLRVTHPSYRVATTELSPGPFTRSAVIRIGMISIESTTEEN